MADFLQRSQAPLTVEEWERLDALVAETARQQLVGRRFINVFGPVGAGHQFVPRVTLAGLSAASLDSSGAGSEPVSVAERSQLPLSLIYKDFIIHWRDIESARQTGLPVDFAAAAAAATVCCAREDDLVFHGDRAQHIEGFSTVDGHRTMTRRDWGLAGHAFLDIVDAIDHMVAAGNSSPYALVCSPNLFACLLRMYGTSGVLELSQARELCTAGVFQSTHVKSAALMAVGVHNMDLVVGQDLTVAYVKSDNMDFVFRVMETVALRVKNPGSVCALNPRASSPTHRVQRGVPEEATGVGD